MKKSVFFFPVLFIFLLPPAKAQVHYPDATLRLHPVWSRVADVYGEWGSIESAEFSPDGRYIVSGSKFDNSVIMWRTSDGAELWRQYVPQEIERVGWSADGKYVASCSEDFMVRVWDAENGDLVKELPHDQGIDGLVWSNEGSLLVTGEEGQTVEKNGEQTTIGLLRVFQMPAGEQIHQVDFGGTINEVMFSDDNKFLLAAGHGGVRVYNAESMELLKILQPDHFVKFTTADFTPDSKYIAASGFGGFIYVWQWQTGELVKRFNYRGRKTESITWHPSGDYLVTSGHGPYINIFRTEDVLSDLDDEVAVAAQVFANDGAEYIDFNADGGFLVSAHQDGVIRLWVWKGEDPYLNERRHRWVSEQQREAQAEKDEGNR